MNSKNNSAFTATPEILRYSFNFQWLLKNKKKLRFVFMSIAKSLLIFIVAGFCEIGGGYLIWLWLKEGKPWWMGLLGAIVLIMYGVAATIQQANFGRVYAAYGGIFIVMALLWGWKIDNVTPDKYDIIGAVVALLGMFIMFYSPRK